MLKGKKGRFRRNLLGKRVDYSGRSVIVIGPRLKLHECGLPKTMALELYRPFVISRLVKQNYASNVKGAKRIIEREKPEVWEALEEVIKERPVLLNRAPTLHRLGIQAFEPQLVEGKAIQIHPLVCSAFNADFDGDQMAVHVPLSDKAVTEARELMLSTRNLLKPADGQPIVAPAKDMVLGIYYLTMDPTTDLIALNRNADKFRDMNVISNPKVRVGVAMRTNGYYYSYNHDIPNLTVFEDVVEEGEDGRRKVVETAVDRTIRAVLEGEVDCMVANAYEARKLFKKKGILNKIDVTNLHQRRRVVDMDEVEYLYNLGIVELHTPILLQNYYDNRPAQDEPEITTVGRAIFNRILPDEIRFVQKTQGKKQLQELVDVTYRRLGGEITPEIVDKIKDLGFKYATVSGTTVAVTDLTIPDDRTDILRDADATIDRAERDFRRGLLTEEERYQRTIETWTKAKDTLQKKIQDALNPFGPIAVMAISGSTKGGFGPITQLAGMRGLMADPSGRIIDLPIRSHFREGLNALEYFISTHGARKGLADTALRTADAGYLTRRLVDVAQDMIINRTDCGTNEALWIRRADDIAGQQLSERIVARCAARDIHDPETGELIVARNGMIDEDVAEKIQAATKIEDVPVRSPMTCALIHGCCALCYGRDLGRGEMVEIGVAVGIIAAQSIGEPGTQLTLRTFHTGGTAQASGDITSGLPRVEEIFEARKKPKGEAVLTDIGGVLRLTKREGIRVATVIHSEVVSEEHTVPAGWTVNVEDGKEVPVGFILAQDEDGDGKLLAGIPGQVYIEDNKIWLRYEKREEADYEIPSNGRLLPEIVDGMTVTPGQQLTEGSKNPHRILRVMGEEATMLYLLTEVQKVYRSQGVNIADKHFEIVIRKMLSRVQLTASGDSDLLPGELVDRLQLIEMNSRLIAEGKEPAAGVPVLLGVTKAALSTDSFLSASSFQHTIRVLAGAAIEGKQDKLYGLKENVIIGKLIPAGTGFHTYQDRELVAPTLSLQEIGAMGAADDVLYPEDDDDDDDK
jgi:DNA-directed RNA polymerase subunit beta'